MQRVSESSKPEQSQPSDIEIPKVEGSYVLNAAVQAWQNIVNSPVPEPDWLSEARALDAVRPYPDARDGALQLVTPYGRPKIEHGDWIVRLSSGRLVIWPDAEFEDYFVED